MAYINGYKYTTEEDAAVARAEAAAYKGYPLKPIDETLYWVNYSEATLNVPEFWYIVYVYGLDAILGEPIEIEINQDII
jgi:hypothetical protein